MGCLKKRRRVEVGIGSVLPLERSRFESVVHIVMRVSLRDAVNRSQEEKRPVGLRLDSRQLEWRILVNRELSKWDEPNLAQNVGSIDEAKH